MELQGLIRNNNYYNLIVNVLFIILLLAFTFTSKTSTSEINNTPIGIAEKTINEVLEVSKTNFIDNGDKIFPFDEIKTNLESLTDIEFDDGSILSIGPETLIIIDEFVYDVDKNYVDASVSITKGFFRFIGSNKKKSFKFSALGSVLGIRGTIFDLSLTNSEEVNIAVYEGDAILINKQGELFSIQNGTAVTLREKDNEQIISSDLSALEKINKLNKKFKRFNNKFTTKENIQKDLNILKNKKVLKIGKLDNMGANLVKLDFKERKKISTTIIDGLLKDNELKLNKQKSHELKAITEKAKNLFKDIQKTRNVNSVKNNNGVVTFSGKLSGGLISNNNNLEEKTKNNNLEEKTKNNQNNLNRQNDKPVKPNKREEKPQKKEKKKK